jgi:hypothetical protein
MIELLVQAELGRRIGQRQTVISKVKLGERRLDVLSSSRSAERLM